MKYKLLLLSILVAYSNLSSAKPVSRIKCDAMDETESRRIPKNELSKIKFKYEITGFDFNRKTKKLKKVVHSIDVSPAVGLKLKSGLLLGHSRGEWGGSLIFKNSAKEKVLIKDNIENIHTFQSGYVVTAGLAHLTSDEGSLYFLKKNKHSGFTILKLYILPSKPVSSWLLKNEELLINLYNHTSYALTPSGVLREVSCRL